MAEPEVLEPDADDKLYRYTTLPNGLKALLISDPVTGLDPGAYRSWK
jgi:secreted Zn-dependent insulinase-like peptidase